EQNPDVRHVVGAGRLGFARRDVPQPHPRTANLNQKAKDLQTQEDDLDQQMDDYTKQLTTQYTALDTMMTKLAGTSSFLQQQFDSLTASK
ncbi:MAG TPA: flagellar filament capping protein FliD, partial [Luteibacter sp.]|nr:flagellar filament capping protein FliD [Luteibacter sp.]